MQRNVGILLAALGAAIIWLLKKDKFERGPRVYRPITVIDRDGRCDVQVPPADVTLDKRKDEKLTWIITNSSDDQSSCGEEVEVRIVWEREVPLEDTRGKEFRRKVKPGETDKLSTKIRSDAQKGKYKYSIYFDDNPVVDPMVEIVT